jgi:hypothetical protein
MIPPGFDFSELREIPRAEARAKLEIPEDAFVLGFVILILIWRPDGLIPAPVARRS